MKLSATILLAAVFVAVSAVPIDIDTERVRLYQFVALQL